eukprot:g5283.t1
MSVFSRRTSRSSAAVRFDRRPVRRRWGRRFSRLNMASVLSEKSVGVPPTVGVVLPNEADMNASTLYEHLSQIQTSWSMVHDAKLGAEAVAEAREQLLRRYRGALYRYLQAVVKDAAVADDLVQEFALRFLRGDFRNADPQRGRFRKFIKTAALNLVRDHHRRKKSQPDGLPENADAVIGSSTEPNPEQVFVDSWKQELLSRAWSALQNQQATELPLYAVLHFRAEHPELRSAQLAERLSAELGKEVTANWVRQVLYRARQQFAEYLLQDVVHSLNQPTPEELEQELRETGLYEYCEPAIAR